MITTHGGTSDVGAGLGDRRARHVIDDAQARIQKVDNHAKPLFTQKWTTARSLPGLPSRWRPPYADANHVRRPLMEIGMHTIAVTGSSASEGRRRH
jgi:hypothetical protein